MEITGGISVYEHHAIEVSLERFMAHSPSKNVLKPIETLNCHGKKH
jgi:hypothetical protein